MKPSIPKGTRDFSPTEMVRRNYIFDTIRNVFQRYGYLPIETPAMENLETLMGKYGEEGDKLIFKILNSGDYLADCQLPTANSSVDYKKLTPQISEKALRYDLTVPFARYVVQHQNDIAFPFKRYQIQPVWRADRPQKGRYREFYQCDADVVGSDSLLNEVELVQMMDDVFSSLKIPVTIKINNRKILSGIAEIIGKKDKMLDIATAIDKYDKIGGDGVKEELKQKGFNDGQIKKLYEIVLMQFNRIMILGEEAQKGDSNLNKLNFLKNGSEFRTSEILQKGVEEMEYLFKSIKACQLKTANCQLDTTLARGLNYYTGAIFEVKANVGNLTSSICGGGRYDNLTGVFGLPNVSGVGISFGVDRIFDVMNELDLYPDILASSTKVMFVNFGEAEEKYALPLLAKVRAANINTEIYPDHAKIKKQFDYANKKQIPFVVVIGSEEMQSGLLTLKNMNSGEQEKVSVEEVIKKLK